jgi:hypothetical protein
METANSAHFFYCKHLSSKPILVSFEDYLFCWAIKCLGQNYIFSPFPFSDHFVGTQANYARTRARLLKTTGHFYHYLVIIFNHLKRNKGSKFPTETTVQIALCTVTDCEIAAVADLNLALGINVWCFVRCDAIGWFPRREFRHSSGVLKAWEMFLSGNTL